MTRVGWVGVGAMGRPMAEQVAARGASVRAFDASPSRLDGLLDFGIEPIGSAREAAEGVELLVVMTATPDQGEVALFGTGEDAPEDGEVGAAAALAPGSCVVVMATVGPGAVERWGTRLAERDVALVDAPVSGGTARAGRGELVTMVGGDPDAVDAAGPVLEAVSSRVVVVGPAPGDGQRMKLVNQLLCGIHIAAAAEALGFAEALGLDAAVAFDVVSRGAAASFMLEDRSPRMLHGEFDQVHSALDIFVKDMGLVTGAAREATYPAPLAAAAEQRYLAARRAGLGRLDDAAIIEISRGLPPRRPDTASSGRE